MNPDHAPFGDDVSAGDLGRPARGPVERLFAAALDGDHTALDGLRRLVPYCDAAAAALEALLVMGGRRHIDATRTSCRRALTPAELAAHDQTIAAVHDQLRRSDVN